MSIKKSLRLSLIIMSALPIIFITVLTYTLSYNKYRELAESSATQLAQDYAQGFDAELNVQIAVIEGLSNASAVQSITLESYNGVALGSDSAYYDSVKELLDSNSKYMNYTVNFYLYDINGYYIASSDDSTDDDWEEYMSVPVKDITSTTIMNASNINKNSDSI